jgi:hypothetical protein
VNSDWRYYVKLEDGTTTRHCWVDRPVESGNRVTLKNSDEPDRWWTVVWVGSEKRHKSLLPRPWTVGGL